MNFLKRNKGTIIAVAIFIIIVILSVQIFNVFFLSDEKALYGNRLEGRDAVRITSDDKDKIISALKDSSKKASVRESGRIINVLITANDDATLEQAKGLSAKVKDQLAAKQVAYYDLQIIIKKDVEANDFPIIGYKHHNKDNFNWTKDRTGTE